MPRPKAAALAASCLVLLSLFSTCAASPPRFAGLRAVHAAPSLPPISISADGQTVLPDLAFFSVSAYAPVAAGRVELEVRRRDSGEAVGRAEVDAVGGDAYTLGIAEGEGGKIKLEVVAEGHAGPAVLDLPEPHGEPASVPGVQGMPAVGVAVLRDPDAAQPRSRRAFTLVAAADVNDPKPWHLLSLANRQRYARRHGYPLHIHLDPLLKGEPGWSRFPALEVALWGETGAENVSWGPPYLPAQGVEVGDDRGYAAPDAEREAWALWLDPDALITTTSAPLDVIVDLALELHGARFNDTKGAKPELDFIVARDCDGLSPSALLVRRSPTSLSLLSRLLAYRLTGAHDERDALESLLESDPAAWGRAQVVPQVRLRSSPEEIGCVEWQAKQEPEDGERPEDWGDGYEYGDAWKSGDFAVGFAGAAAARSRILGTNPDGTTPVPPRGFDPAAFLFERYWGRVDAPEQNPPKPHDPDAAPWMCDRLVEMLALKAKEEAGTDGESEGDGATGQAADASPAAPAAA
ncbi:hypothetical protein DFJ74DRAFT_703375 [Hyaloraphidium curvatum]|nr:hypothetical protein DFJ74DRAFT_703375 [Hyaloraphidium curvatum]